MTDSGAIDFMVSKFKRFNNTKDAAAATMNAGVDLNSGNAYLQLKGALNESLIKESQIDTALNRVTQARPFGVMDCMQPF